MAERIFKAQEKGSGERRSVGQVDGHEIQKRGVGVREMMAIQRGMGSEWRWNSPGLRAKQHCSRRRTITWPRDKGRCNQL